MISNYYNHYTMKLPFDFGVCFDLEFSGSAPVTNQTTGIGVCLRNNDGKILEEFVCFPIHLDENRQWESGCLEWWNSIPEMSEMRRRIDNKENTVSLSDAVKSFVDTVQSWMVKYNDHDVKSCTKPKKWCWVTD